MNKNKLLFIMFYLLWACNGAQTDNSDGKQDNFKFSEDQLGVVSFSDKTIDFGKVVLEDARKNISKLKILENFLLYLIELFMMGIKQVPVFITLVI